MMKENIHLLNISSLTIRFIQVKHKIIINFYNMKHTCA